MVPSLVEQSRLSRGIRRTNTSMLREIFKGACLRLKQQTTQKAGSQTGQAHCCVGAAIGTCPSAEEQLHIDNKD